eukprot:CAMPEP_0194571086 /NCGR_PEP_ID=MMETSP0292-20121207/8171_1 /TAXON_ID=39354 /ORGANISM="Heterosigma akashiwo, Strain CCMP2393" /LENGTH=30 /DNA_ID= /DNA_START= /DNA_END= /DNA_ORIENTATION=
MNLGAQDGAAGSRGPRRRARGTACPAGGRR